MVIDSGFSHKKLKQLLPWLGKMMTENHWQSVKISTEDFQLRLARKPKIKKEIKFEKNTETLKESSKESSKQLIEVKAPMTGTYYAAASPSAPPFVQVGSYVKVGQTLCIIEAMKLMNTIESEHEGQIVEILVSNAQMVRAGQVLMLIS